MAERSLAERYKSAQVEILTHRASINYMEHKAQVGVYEHKKIEDSKSKKAISRDAYYLKEKVGLDKEIEKTEGLSAEDMLSEAVRQRKEELTTWKAEAIADMNNEALPEEERAEAKERLGHIEESLGKSDEEMAAYIVEDRENVVMSYRVKERAHSLVTALELQGRAYNRLRLESEYGLDDLQCEGIVPDINTLVEEIKNSPEFAALQAASKNERKLSNTLDVVDTIGASSFLAGFGSGLVFLGSFGAMLAGADLDTSGIIGGAGVIGGLSGASVGGLMTLVSNKLNESYAKTNKLIRDSSDDIAGKYIRAEKEEMGE
ncbi:MAG: hypothetical protein IJA61_04300 [Clostridia bacterium]|nr:hypothetical protein [Clostridia bacterium]